MTLSIQVPVQLPGELSVTQRREWLSQCIRTRLAEFLGFESAEEIGVDDAFVELGTDSSQAIAFKVVLEKMFGCTLRTSVLFEYPTVRSLVELIDGLTADAMCINLSKSPTVLLDKAQTKQNTSSEKVKSDSNWRQEFGDFEELVPTSYPLSETQLGLWYISEALNYASSYHVPLLFRLKQPLDLSRWNLALQKIARKHPALLVCFRPDGESGIVRQQVMPAESIEPVRPLAKSLHETWRQAMLSVLREPFDLKSCPPLRSVAGCDEIGHFVLLVFHHIVADGLAAVPLIDELWHEYARGQDAKDLPSSDHSKKTDDRFWCYLEWEKNYLLSEQCARDESFWQAELQGISGDLGLPRLIDLATEESTGCITQSLKETASQQLRTLSRELKSPVSVVLLALYALLLSRLGGRQEVAVTTPVSGRPGGQRGEFRDAVGCFINLIVTRIQIEPTQSFEQLVSVVRRAFLEGVEHGHLPFARQLKLAGQRSADIGHKPFPLSFTYQNIFESWQADTYWQQFASLDLSLFQEVEDDLTFEVYEFRDNYQLNWKFRSHSFSRSCIESWSESYWHLLQQVMANPCVVVKDLTIASPEIQHRVFSRLDRRHLAQCSPNNVVQWIDQTASRFPDTVAIVCDGQQITYQQLVLQSHFYADQLLRSQIGSGDIVILPAYRNPDTLVRLLAILRCGAAYLPIDPNGPRERSSRMVQQAGAVPFEFEEADPSSHEITRHTQATPTIDVQIHGASQIAYVLFTSGSTGQPKGVPVRHDSLVNLCHAMIQLYSLQPSDHVLQFASLTFDMSVEEIFPTWCSGGTLVMRADDELEPHRLVELVENQHVSVANLPPSYHQALVAAGSSVIERFYRKLRLVAFGGDTLTADVLEDVCRLGPVVYNVYGPTEATVNATAARVDRLLSNGSLLSKNTTIGEPLPGVAVMVMDQERNMLSTYCPGELCIAGSGLSDGYLAGVDSTAFIACTLPGDDRRSRVYCTGDRALITEDGQIVLLGRTDDQLSIRGHRIEPQEIEVALQQHPAISQSTVVECQGCLIAFLKVSVPNTGRETFERHLRDKLPAIMIPTHFVEIDEWPLNERGKRSRRMLRERAELWLRTHVHENKKSEEQSDPRASTELWKTINTVLCHSLNVATVRPSDRFFELGGHSLLAIASLAKLNHILNCDLPLRLFLGAETLGDLYDLFNQRLTSRKPQMVEQPSKESKKHLTRGVLSPSQARLYFLDRLGEQSSYIVPALAEVHGTLDRQLLCDAFGAIASRHEILRTNFVEDDKAIVQIIHHEYHPDLKEQTFADREDALEWIEKQILCPFHLQSGPLWNVRLARYSLDRSLLLINMHHIITDGWSMQVLMNELQLYFRDGNLHALGHLPLQYADYAARSVVHQASSESIAYWKNQLVDWEEIELTTDFPRPAVLSSRGDTVVRYLNDQSSRRISEFSSQNGVAPSAVWLAALYTLLRKRRCGDDLIVGVPVAGRNATELEGLIGFFVNTVALRLRVVSNERMHLTRLSLVRQVADLLADGLQHQNVPIEEIIRLAQPERRTDRSPLFQILFNYAASLPTEFQLGAAKLLPQLPASKSAKFELTFSVNQWQNRNHHVVAIEYATDLFRQSSIEAMAQQWIDLVEQIISQPDETVHTLRLDSKYPQLSRNVRKSLRAPQSFEEAFQAQVQQSDNQPEQFALCVDQERLTYRELCEATSICMAEMPHDHMILVQPNRELSSLLRLIAAFRSGKTIIFDPCLSRSSLPTDVAVVLPTSGSTNSAKSVAVRAESLNLHGDAFVKTFQIKRKDRVAQFASMTFDLFLEELLPALRAGACVHVVPQSCRLDPRLLAQWTADNGITVLDLPTAVFHLLVSDTTACERLSQNLRLLIVGGEELSVDAARTFVGIRPNIELWNTYGPTEATIICTAHRFDPQVNLDEVPLGDSFADAVLTVVDCDGQSVPPGVVGELIIDGPGVAAGYVRDGALAIDAGFSGNSHGNAIRYATGDKVVRTKDGLLQFLGRLDDQLKIRGHRLNPLEIVSLLRKNRCVKDVAVVARNVNNESQLIAAIVVNRMDDPTDDMSSTAMNTLGKKLAETLPMWMRPHHWIQVDSIPISARGKIDRKAIIELAMTSQAGAAETLDQPVSKSEQRVMQAWKQILAHDRFCRNDDFFLVGGHSLMAVQLVNLIENDLGVRLPLVEVFQYRTVREMAERLEQLASSSSLAPEKLASNNSLVRVLPVKSQELSAVDTTVIFPGLPGLGDLYYPLAEQLLSVSNVWLMTMPGFDGQTPASSLDDIAQVWNRELHVRCRLPSVDKVYKNFHESEGRLAKLPGSPLSESRLQLIAHSYSGSVLTRLLTLHPHWLSVITEIVLVDCWPHLQNQTPDVIDKTWLERLDLDLIPGARNVLETCLAAPSLASEHQLDVQVKLVIAESSQAMLDASLWEPYYREVKAYVVDGDHTTIMQPPKALHWLRKLGLIESSKL